MPVGQHTARPASSGTKTVDLYMRIWLYSYMSIQIEPNGLDRAFAALADPTRRAILARLAQGEATVNELVEPFHLTQPTISRHLKVLEEARLIERGKDAQRRPRKLVLDAFRNVEQWLEPFQRQWGARFDNLAVHLDSLQSKEK
jgi:DNA-binding transcriptional ArsR family regulator